MPRGWALLWKFFQIFVCESLGTGIVCFPALMMPPATSTPDITTPLVCGIAVYLGLWITGATSGGQMNPVVTLAAALTRRTPLIYVPVYLAAQLCGSLVSMGIASRLSPFRPDQPKTYGLTLPSANTSVGTAIGMEIVVTMILIMTWLASLDEVRDIVWRMQISNNFPISMLFAITFGVAIGGPVSGASMNPWRSLSAAIVQNHYDYVWIYFVGPPIGSILACILYEFIICEYTSTPRIKHWFTAKHFDRSLKYTDEDSSDRSTPAERHNF